jgi:hypothetical protein
MGRHVETVGGEGRNLSSGRKPALSAFEHYTPIPPRPTSTDVGSPHTGLATFTSSAFEGREMLMPPKCRSPAVFTREGVPPAITRRLWAAVQMPQHRGPHGNVVSTALGPADGFVDRLTDTSDNVLRLFGAPVSSPITKPLSRCGQVAFIECSSRGGPRRTSCRSGWLEDVQPIRRVLAAARPVVEVGTVRARGFVVFSTGHPTGCLGADARKHRRIVVPDIPTPPLLEQRRLRSGEPRVLCVCGCHGGSQGTALGTRMRSAIV